MTVSTVFQIHSRINSQAIARLVRHARKYSPFYRELYQSMPAEVHSLAELPILDTHSFWSANTLKDNRVLTGPIEDGILLKSGGTTGSPKFSVFARDEWDEFTLAFSQGLAQSGLRNGDRVANLFYVGELYGSFLFTHKVLECGPLRILNLPIAGSTSPSEILKMARECDVTVLAGVPTTLMTLVECLEQTPAKDRPTQIRMLLFAGEAMYPDQRERALRVLPGVEIRSIGYASTDAGLLGFSDTSCGPNEFRCFDTEAVFEILDEETLKPIHKPGQPGIAVVTSLHRFLMPIIRYPVGDRAHWIEPESAKNRKFLLLGRSSESARVGPVTLYFEDLRSVLQSFENEIGVFQFQLVIAHHQEKDELQIRIASRTPDEVKLTMTSKIVESILENRPMYRKCMEDRKIHPITVEWVHPGELIVNPRTGKLRRVMDLR